VITVGDVVQEIRRDLLALSGQFRGEALRREQARVFEAGLEELIEKQLMLAKFRQLGAELPASAVRERADLLMRQQFNDDRAAFQKALEAAGKTERDWREEIREQLITQSMVQQFVRSPIHVAPREIRAAYEERKEELIGPVELKVSAIAFRPVPEEKKRELEENVQEIFLRLEAGDDFAALAREYSEGPKAAQGGNQGWVNLDTLPSPLPEVLGDLQPGDRTGLVETPVQYYLFEVSDRRGGNLIELAEAQPQIERDLREEKFLARYDAWIEGLKEEFQIVRYNPDISAVTGEL
jgi:parvulin-like peptidyl-prolyl isomerase